MRQIIVAVLLASTLAVSCGSLTSPPTDAGDGGMLAVLAAGLVARDTAADPRATAKEKAQANALYFDAAYKYARSDGLKPAAAKRVARAMVDDKEIPQFTCADYATPPADCLAKHDR